MRNRYKLISEGGQEFARAQGVAEPELDAEHELELSAEQERSMIAAGWISERIEEKKEGKK